VYSDLPLLLGALLSVAGVAFFSSAETVFLSLDRMRLPARIARNERGARRLGYFIERPERYVVTTLTGNSLVAVIYSSLSAILLAHLGMSEQLILIISPLFILIFGETVPKILGRQFAETVAPTVARSLFMVRFLTSPLNNVIERSVEFLRRRLGLRSSLVGMVLSRADITVAVTTGRRHGSVSLHEEHLIQRLLKLSERSITDVMTPRTRVTSVQIGDSVREAIHLVETTGHKRLICLGRGSDDVLGVILAVDLMKSPLDLSQILRPLPMIPESLPMVRLIEWFRGNRTHFAGVLDEYGGFSGIVSVEDLAEELVGPIDDQEGPPNLDCLKVKERLWLVAGRARLSHIAQLTGFEPSSSHAATFGGFISELAEDIPEAGDEFVVAGATLRVIKADPRGARLIRLTFADNQEPS
jgi:putative hemolysin